MNINELITKHKINRAKQIYPVGLKINLYRDYEVEALSIALQQLKLPKPSPIECLMIGDSYVTTHLGRASTQLKSLHDQVKILEILLSLIKEINQARNFWFTSDQLPYLVGDMPDGSYINSEVALRTAEAMVQAGAEVVKLEVTSAYTLDIIAELTNHGFFVMAHTGYTPQTKEIFRHGDNLSSSINLLQLAGEIRDAGAIALVIEMVSEIINTRLCLPVEENSLLIYSIFSGKTKFGGQSLNIWDAVIKHKNNSKYFPPTAELSVDQYPEFYTKNKIASNMAKLISLTLSGEFPLTPNTKLDDDAHQKIIEINPWAYPNKKDIIISKIQSNESNCRVYCRKYPRVFTMAKDYTIYDIDNIPYLDFFSCAGVLNYGHNNNFLKESLFSYLKKEHIVHSLDFFTQAKYEFIASFNEIILNPRQFVYKYQFTGPTGTNAVEAALKISRKYTGRNNIIAFTNSFHGMTLGSLAATGNKMKRAGAGVALPNIQVMPYDDYLGNKLDSLMYLEHVLNDPSSGIELPAAFIVESIQGEGGLNTASNSWLLQLQKIAHDKNILLILDEIQAGCGRTGKFFSFEDIGIYPDIICLSKSLSGYGLPMALVLLRPEIDVQQPGEHSGTFRGNNLAFVTGKAALSFWDTPKFTDHITVISKLLDVSLEKIANDFKFLNCTVKGKGLFRGLAWGDDVNTNKILNHALKNGLLIETSGGNNQVIKIMPPLIISEAALNQGLEILYNSINEMTKTDRVTDYLNV